jgi:hypothetical protein
LLTSWLNQYWRRSMRLLWKKWDWYEIRLFIRVSGHVVSQRTCYILLIHYDMFLHNHLPFWAYCIWLIVRLRYYSSSSQLIATEGHICSPHSLKSFFVFLFLCSVWDYWLTSCRHLLGWIK